MGMREANDNASGLKAHPLGSLETIAIIIGTNIGAGQPERALRIALTGGDPGWVALAVLPLAFGFGNALLIANREAAVTVDSGDQRSCLHCCKGSLNRTASATNIVRVHRLN